MDTARVVGSTKTLSFHRCKKAVRQDSSLPLTAKIHPRSSSDVAAVTTVDRLALDLPKLNALRAAAVGALDDLPESDIKRVLVRGQDGSFPSTLRLSRMSCFRRNTVAVRAAPMTWVSISLLPVAHAATVAPPPPGRHNLSGRSTTASATPPGYQTIPERSTWPAGDPVAGDARALHAPCANTPVPQQPR